MDPGVSLDTVPSLPCDRGDDVERHKSGYPPLSSSLMEHGVK